MPTFLPLLVLVLLLHQQLTFAILTISIKGSKFFTSDGDQFYIKGVVYSPDAQEYNSLTNGAQCAIDAQLIANLGANVVRVYGVDPTLNHDECMKAFEDRGIYVVLGMTTPVYTVNRANPEWTIDLRNALAQVIDAFQAYDNTLAFFAGNEFINDQATSKVGPYAKAVAADMKAYRDLMQYRTIPIGYSAADVAEIRSQQQDYFSCGPANTSVDFYAFNRYSWCGSSSMAESGYNVLYEEADGYDIPIFLSETGCHVGDADRDFEDQVAMLGREMNDRYSGNIIYEWAQHENKYGLVSYDNDAATGTPSMMGDYTRLKSQWATLDPTGVKASAYSPSLTNRACPTSTSGGWLVQKNADLPTLGTSGLTAPTGSRSTTRASATSTTGGSAGSSATGFSSSLNNNNPSQPSKTPVGAIAGGVLGGLVVLALILGLILFLLRHKRKARAALESQEDGTANRPAGDLIPVTDEEEKIQQNGFYGPGYHELHGQGTMAELDPARGHAAAMPAAEMASHRGPVEAGIAGESEEERGEREGAPVQSRSGEERTVEPSPYVQAQRNMEMEWLESEEARLRQRRELLIRQNGGGS